MVKTILTPPKLLNDLVLEELFQVFDIWLLPEGILEKLDDNTRPDTGDFTDLLLSFGVVDHQHEGVLVLIVLLGGKIEAALHEELLGVFSCGRGYPVVVLSTVHVLELFLDVCAKCSQDLLDENISLDPYV